MATIVNNPGTTERVVEVDRSDSSAGWAVAIIVLLAVLAVGAYLYTHRADTTQPAAPGASINVTLPSAGYQPAAGDTSGAGGNTTAPTQ